MDLKVVTNVAGAWHEACFTLAASSTAKINDTHAQKCNGFILVCTFAVFKWFCLKEKNSSVCPPLSKFLKCRKDLQELPPRRYLEIIQNKLHKPHVFFLDYMEMTFKTNKMKVAVSRSGERAVTLHVVLITRTRPHAHWQVSSRLGWTRLTTLRSCTWCIARTEVFKGRRTEGVFDLSCLYV